MILLGIGVAITAGTFALSAHGGGLFIVSFGPIIFGAIYLIQGGLALAKLKGQPEVPPQVPQFPAYPPAPQKRSSQTGSTQQSWQQPASGWRPPGR